MQLVRAPHRGGLGLFLWIAGGPSQMDLILLIIMLSFGLSLRYRSSGPNTVDLNRQTTTTINGFFLLLVVFSHFMTYIELPTEFAKLSQIWMLVKGQLIVTTFLFFSGYGIYVQFKKRGRQYLKTFPKHRLLFLWMKFALAVTSYLVIGLVTKRAMTLPQVGLSYLGLATIGNSAWYIFIILFLYLLTYFAWEGFPTSNRQALGFIIIGCGVYLLIANWLLPEYYANTVFCYVAGMLYGHYKAAIERVVCRNWPTYWLVGLGTLAIFATSYLICAKTTGLIRMFNYQIAAIMFAFCFVMLAMRFKIHNPILAYIGGPAMFSIYILQRIPMMLLQSTGLANQPIGYFISVLIGTLLLGWLFDKIFNKVWSQGLSLFRANA